MKLCVCVCVCVCVCICVFEDSLALRLASLPDQEPPVSAVRRIITVTLPKEPRVGVGVTIVGGENVGALDLGCFVRSVIPGGPADRDGRIRPGDRIIAINGQSVEGVPHHRAVELIRDAPGHVQLMLSQAREPLQVPELLSRESSPSPNELAAEHILIDPPDSQRFYAPPSPSSPQQEADLPSSLNSSDLDLEDMLSPDSTGTSGRGRKSKTPEGRRSSTPIQRAIEEGLQSVASAGKWSARNNTLSTGQIYRHYAANMLQSLVRCTAGCIYSCTI